MNSITLIPAWIELLKLGLREDSFAFDWTARAAAKEKATHAKLIAKANGIWAGAAGLQALKLLSVEMGMPLEITSKVKDGDAVSNGTVICEWTGSATAVVVFERTFINLASYASGIATQTHELMKLVTSANLKNPPRVTGTRKILPGYRDLAIQSTLIGGAHPHRYNLSGGLLLKENHIAAAGSIEGAVRNARSVIPHVLKIEIEVRDLRELKEAIVAQAEVIMLDNFSPELVREAIKLKPANIMFETSGGIHAGNMSQYCIEGLDVISVGSITHSVTALDLSLLVSAD
jgi:nicotinate-nucleotide pyrophosphorylase (carboxylating)